MAMATINLSVGKPPSESDIAAALGSVGLKVHRMSTGRGIGGQLYVAIETEWQPQFTVIPPTNPAIAAMPKSTIAPPDPDRHPGPVYREPKQFCRFLGSARSGR